MSNSDSDPNLNSAEYELLSAYLDHELSDSECTRVELLLAESSQARLILDDLKKSRSAVAGLPVYPGTGKSVDWGLVARQLNRGTEATQDESESLLAAHAMDEPVVSISANKQIDFSTDYDKNVEEQVEHDERPSREVISPVRSKYRWVMPVASAACLVLAIGLGYGLLTRTSGEKLEVSSRVLTNEKSAELPNIREIAKGQIDPSEKALVDNAGMPYPPMAERAFKGPLAPGSEEILPDLYNPTPAEASLPDLPDLDSQIASNERSASATEKLEQMPQEAEVLESNRRSVADSSTGQGGMSNASGFSEPTGSAARSETLGSSSPTRSDSIASAKDAAAQAYSAESQSSEEQFSAPVPQLSERPMQSQTDRIAGTTLESNDEQSAMKIDSTSTDTRQDAYPFHREAISVQLPKNLVVARTSSWTTAELESELGDNNLLASAAGLPTEQQAALRSRYSVNRAGSSREMRRVAAPLIVTSRPASVKPDEVVSRLQRSAPVTQLTSESAAVTRDAEAVGQDGNTSRFGQGAGQQGAESDEEQTMILFVNPFEADFVLAEFPAEELVAAAETLQPANDLKMGATSEPTADSSGLQRAGKRPFKSPAPMRIYQRSDAGSGNTTASERVVVVLTPPQ